MVNQIEIVVKVKDQASAETAAIAEKIRTAMAAAPKSAGASGGSVVAPIMADAEKDIAKAKGDISKGMEDVHKSMLTPLQQAEADADAVFERLWRNGQGRTERLALAMSDAYHGIEADTKGFTASESKQFDEFFNELNKSGGDAALKLADRMHLIKAPQLDTTAARFAADQFETEFRKAMDEGEKASASAETEIRRSFTSIESGSRTLRAAMAELEPAAEGAGRSVEDAGNKADDAGKKAANSGNGFKWSAVGMGTMITAALALAPALAAIPALAGAVAVGAGTMTLGLGGVVKALKDYGQASMATGQSSAQLALTAFNNSVAIRNGEQAIAAAKLQAAQAAQTSANQIHSAQERVAASAYALQQAELKLTDAEKAETDAQKALTQARADAENQIKDLNNTAADSSIAVQQAELTLKEAREKLAQVTSNSLSTDDQKKQTAIDLASAQQGLIDAQQHQTEAQQAATAANKAGVNGMPAVVSAQNNVTNAIRGVADAHHNLSDAQQAQADAQKALAQTVKAAADQQVASAQAIAKAQQALADTYTQQRLSAAAAAASGSSAANLFAQDMKKLTPAAQDFVRQLIGMKKGADELGRTAQNAMMPGLTVMLKDSAPLLPIFNKAVGDMGGVVGNTAIAFGNLMKSPAFQGQLTQVLKDGAGFAQKFADGMVTMTRGVTDAASKAGPIVSGLGSGIKDLMSSGIPNLLAGLASNAPGAGQALNNLLGIVSDLLGPLGTLVGAISGALGPVLEALRPVIGQLANVLVQTLVPVINNLSPLLVLLAHLIGALMPVISPVLKIIGQLADMFLRQLVPALQPLIPVIAQFATSVGQALTSAFTQLMPSLNQMLKAFVQLLPALIPIIPPLGQLIAALIQLFAPSLKAQIQMVTLTEVAIKPLTTAVGWLAKTVLPWLTDAVNLTIGPLKSISDTAGSVASFVVGAFGLGGMVNWIKGLPGRVASAATGLWDPIWNEFKRIYNDIANAWNNLSFTLPGLDLGPLGKIGGWTVGVPSWADIPTIHAFGGVLSGGITGVIGDRGWEPLRLPDGTTVIPHANAQAALASTGMGGAGAVRVELEWAPGSGGGDELLTWLRRSIRIRAGNSSNSVQKVLGQAF